MKDRLKYETKIFLLTRLDVFIWEWKLYLGPLPISNCPKRCHKATLDLLGVTSKARNLGILLSRVYQTEGKGER